ncbi:hypothetical protein EI427_08120 [Flammeovirga pectinis]|uniref:Uncharacterized protein n=1 Tax=Flammeovirga pectinis TaxID=2494373 RepID=A0A3Q9FQ53_9BACT|nr:hypothetical protein [Flammeovirga pectinis]AZQ62202.1 hypothetical protein EI427_08120 [Flammeovirga pectinis]
MTISSMIQPDKKISFFQIVEFSVYRFYTLIKEGKGNIGEGKQCFKLKGRGVNLYSKKEFLEYNDLDELLFDEICMELWVVSEKTPKWDIDRLFAYKNEIVDNLSNILECSSINDLELYISDSRTASFVYVFLSHFYETALSDKKLGNINTEMVSDNASQQIAPNKEFDKGFNIEILERFQLLEDRIIQLERENKRLETRENDYFHRVDDLENTQKQIDNLEEQFELVHKARKTALQEISINVEQKFESLVDKINSINEESFNKESVREFIVRLDQLERQIVDVKSEYVKDEAIQSFSKQLDILNKSINHISDEHGNELKKVDLRFTKIKGERHELRDSMSILEENLSNKLETLSKSLTDELENIHNISDEMTRRQQELQSVLQDKNVDDKAHLDKVIEGIAASLGETQERQQELWESVNKLINRTKNEEFTFSEVVETKAPKTIDVEKASYVSPSSTYIESFYAEPDGNGFLTNLSTKKITYKHVYKVNVIDDVTADFEFVDEADSKRTLNMNLAMMFDEYMSDNGTKGSSLELSLYGEAKKVRGLNAWRVSRKAMVTRR